MKLRNKQLIALGLIWFVLLTILLTTTENATGIVFSSFSGLRGILRGLSYNQFTLGAGIVGLVALAILTFLTLIYILRAWSSTIHLTRNLVKFLFLADNPTPEAETNTEAEKNLIHSLFGDAITSGSSFLWLALRSLLALWVLIVIFSLVVGVINLLANY